MATLVVRQQIEMILSVSHRRDKYSHMTVILLLPMVLLTNVTQCKQFINVNSLKTTRNQLRVNVGIFISLGFSQRFFVIGGGEPTKVHFNLRQL
jgi:hypothetical protein